MTFFELYLKIELLISPDFAGSIQVPIGQNEVILNALLNFLCFCLQVLGVVDHLLPEVPFYVLILNHHLCLSLQELTLQVLYLVLFLIDDRIV